MYLIHKHKLKNYWKHWEAGDNWENLSKQVSSDGVSFITRDFTEEQYLSSG